MGLLLALFGLTLALVHEDDPCDVGAQHCEHRSEAGRVRFW